MATSEGIPSSIDIEFLELNDNPYLCNRLLPSQGNRRLLCANKMAFFSCSVVSLGVLFSQMQ